MNGLLWVRITLTGILRPLFYCSIDISYSHMPRSLQNVATLVCNLTSLLISTTLMTGQLGTIPYWEWGLDCDDIDSSPLFDGSATSLGSNGEKITNRTSGPIPGMEMPGAPLGTGGGCVHSGPFVNYTVNMGPVVDPDPTRYNPRCLKRDLNPYICKNWASLRNTTTLILDSPNIELFQAIMQGDARYPEAQGLLFGVHGGGHYTISMFLIMLILVMQDLGS